MSDGELVDRLKWAMSQRLESLQRSGVEMVPKPVAPPPEVIEQARAAAAEAAAGDSSEASQEATAAQASDNVGATGDSAQVAEIPGQQTHSLSRGEREAALASLCSEVAGCTRCGELAGSRTQTVFGVGNPEARLCFLGEAPGGDEDRKGEPFVGAAGQLLTKIIQACTLRREDVYILNILRCRPPGNRNPHKEEADNCRPFLERQLEIIRPEFICCLGGVAAQNLLETTQTVGAMRRRFHRWRDAQVLVTYHPAYLLREPSAKRKTWEDMQMLMQEMGIELKT